MSKKFILCIGLAIFVVVLMAFAGTALAYTPGLHSNVAGGVHDVAVDEPLCDPCHVPHGAAAGGTFLWPSPPQTLTGFAAESEIAPLCYSCHDGTGMPGQYTAFDGTKYTHPIQTATARRANVGGTPRTNALDIYGRDCDRCHDPHEDSSERPNFIRYTRISTAASQYTLALGPNICATCHSGNVNGWADRSNVVHGSHKLDLDGEVQDVLGLGGFSSINPAMAVYDPSVPTAGTRFFLPSAGLPAVKAAFPAVAGFGDKAAYDPTTHELGLSPATVATSQLKCESCHAPHGAVTDEASGLNTMNAEDGSLCSNCHL